MGGADEEVLNEIRATYGLDKPFIVQLGSYIGKVLRFDLGYSFFYTQPVTKLIFEKLPATLLLVLTSQFLLECTQPGAQMEYLVISFRSLHFMDVQRQFSGLGSFC
jgi:ABC-type microcin C transport system permease subunit YejB